MDFSTLGPRRLLGVDRIRCEEEPVDWSPGWVLGGGVHWRGTRTWGRPGEVRGHRCFF
jgi:hypothetical protein